MKKLLMVILCASVISPSLAFANNNKSERNGENNSRKPAQMVQRFEKKEVKKETKSFKKDDDNDNDGKHRYASSTLPVQVVQKTNYFLCKTDTGWNVVSLAGERNKNSAGALGGFCMKLPYGFAKRFYNIPVATTTVDTLAPVISSLGASSVTPASATISWTTNEVANGNLYIGTSNPLVLATATTLGTTTLSMSHSFNLTGLTASTTYYYVVKSADAANNTSTSTQQSFMTPAVADTTAPIISGFSTSTVASTTATVSWNTNELATGKLWYGTSTPLTLFTSTTTLSTAHSFNLTGLTASTTYQLLFEAKDSATNTATTTASFTTTI